MDKTKRLLLGLLATVAYAQNAHRGQIDQMVGVLAKDGALVREIKPAATHGDSPSHPEMLPTRARVLNLPLATADLKPLDIFVPQQ